MIEVHGAKIFPAVVAGVIMSWLSEVWIFVALTFVAICIDYITGIMAGRLSETGLISDKMRKGIYKKVGTIALCFLSLFLDVALDAIVIGNIGFEMPFHLPVAHVVTMWIIITEAISVTENLEKLGVHIPAWLIKFLKKGKRSIDNDNTSN